MVGTLEEAQLLVMTAMQILERHDEVMGQMAEHRSKFEMARVMGKEKPDPNQFNLEMGQIENRLETFRERVTSALSQTMSWSEFRFAVNKCNYLWGRVSEVRESMLSRKLWEQTIPEEDRKKADNKEGEEKSWTLGQWEEMYQKTLDLFFEAVTEIKLSRPSTLVTLER